MITDKTLEAFQYASRNFNISSERESPTAYLLTAFNNHRRERLEVRRVEYSPLLDEKHKEFTDHPNGAMYEELLEEFESLKTKYIFDYNNQFTK